MLNLFGQFLALIQVISESAWSYCNTVPEGPNLELLYCTCNEEMDVVPPHTEAIFHQVVLASREF